MAKRAFGAAAMGCAIGLVVGGLTGCGGKVVSKDPIEDLRNPAKGEQIRMAAIEQSRGGAMPTEAKNDAARRLYKEIFWAEGESQAMRAAALDALLNDPDPAVRADARTMARLRLPREPRREMVVHLSQLAGESGWTEFTPALVRSYAREIPGVSDQIRSERVALGALHPERDVRELVFEVFLNPPAIDDGRQDEWNERTRVDAWDLLARLDPTGEERARMLAAAPEDAGDGTVAAMRRAQQELDALPRSGEELRWLLSLADVSNSENAAWWREASAAIASFNAVERGAAPLELRHAEAIRWAAAHRSDWAAASRGALLAELRTRLADRKHYRRTTEVGPSQIKDDLASWEATLTRADLLTILILDGLIAEPQVVEAFFKQAEMDRRDNTTEYGGLLASGGPGKAQALLFPPRPGQRTGDNTFIASQDMIAAGDRAIGHYHFHVQDWQNAEFAGPSPGDLVYADRLGRSCLVLTGISETTLAVDYYQPGDRAVGRPGGAVIDLGVVHRDGGRR